MDFIQVGKNFERYQSSAISEVIHPEDVMFKNGEAHYYTVGESAMKVINLALANSWRKDVIRILDLPCGHGRVARHLRPAFPEAELFFCDIDSSGAEFCADQFDGKAIISEPDLTAVKLPQELDLIWIGSLFTHIDAGRSEAWLRYLIDHLADQGILITTMHGYYFRELVECGRMPFKGDWDRFISDFEGTGYAYEPYPKSPDYGISISKPDWVVDLAMNIPGVRMNMFLERGWANNHDVLVISKNDRKASAG